MHCIVMGLEERLLSMQQCFLSKLDIIPDELDAVVAAIFHCDINNRPAASGLLVASEAVCIPLSFWLGVTDITSATRSLH